MGIGKILTFTTVKTTAALVLRFLVQMQIIVTHTIAREAVTLIDHSGNDSVSVSAVVAWNIRRLTYSANIKAIIPFPPGLRATMAVHAKR